MDIDMKELALQPVELETGPAERYSAAHRMFQGIPAIERTPGGRLWAAFYSGGKGEGPDNYVLLATSGDDGTTWDSPCLAVDPVGKVRAFDPCLWIDPLGRLWLCWAQSYGLYDGRCGVWAALCDNPEEARPRWSKPRRLGNGVMLNKPTVLSTGEWLFPVALWENKNSYLNHLPEERFSNVLATADQGETFELRGRADVPQRHYDEHMIVERCDGSLWMLVRTTYGIGESFSLDRGRTWSPGRPTRLGGPNSRFFIRRLRSGRLLLVNHYGFHGRSHLTAQLSEDDGATWTDGLLLDGRSDVSYPDGTEAADGTIYVIYDRERNRDMEIVMAVFTEEDVLAERGVTAAARFRVIVDKAGLESGGTPGLPAAAPSDFYLGSKWNQHALLKKIEDLERHPDRETGEDSAKKAVYLAVRYIDERLLYIQDLKEVSEVSGYSLPHLSRLFVKELGDNLRGFYTKRKWLKAMELLEEGSGTVTKVASMMQYESIHTFSRAFRKATGLSPLQYVRKHKETCEASAAALPVHD
ncbi:exo-alpha-sialidase [Paenibacillus hodogayensis]|uniref:Exo-alpha-sialidase n=1 Tax=Paenibacillus hodogayensis TaxID=279208 RepID=A0ABV5W2P8_9BACL